MSQILPTDWAPNSWEDKDALQQPVYPNAAVLEQVVAQIRTLPPLVSSWEIENLKKKLAEATLGRGFVLQGGECAESIHECKADLITARLKLLLQMSLVLVYGLRSPVVRVGRFAGQYAKPRSADLETRDGITLPSYRGDMINQNGFTSELRMPDPYLMISAHSFSALTLNFVRSLTAGGFADLHHPEYWDLDFVGHSPLEAEYRQIVEAISDAVRFAETIQSSAIGGADRADIYTSHEALLLPYESAVTRSVPHRQGNYNLSTHFPWIGMRTADPASAHIEYARGIQNPVGVKIGPDTSVADVTKIVRILNPKGIPGKLSLITRMGAESIEDRLPPLISAVESTGLPVLWICDPMHGNTEISATGYKTRRFDNIIDELELAFDVHERSGTYLGGVHLELTGENVTECTGGARGLSDDDLQHAYKSPVDPRLNAEQALEVAFRIVRKHKRA